MADYRLFLLDLTEHIVGVDVLACASDADVLRLAGTRLGPHPAGEVWLRERRVGRVTAMPDGASVPHSAEFP